MKKRILCAILTLIMLVSLVPTAAMNASAASYKVSESAITVLKQLQGYTAKCSTKGYAGYGTPCDEEVTTASPHGTHWMGQEEADQALRAELAGLDTAVKNFASSNGLSLTQYQHDALVLFSFRNGTAWMSGTGDVKRAVTTRATGNEFLNMFCNWRNEEADNQRRLIEANMYLNGVYSSSVPSKYIKVSYNTNGGSLTANKTTFYYDLTLSDSVLPIPTRGNYTFAGWYDENNQWVDKLSTAVNGKTLTANWQDASNDKVSFALVATYANYTLDSSLLSSSNVYKRPNDGKQTSKVSGKLHVSQEFVDQNGVKWCYIDSAEKYTYIDNDKKTQTVENYTTQGWWVKTKKIVSGMGSGASGVEIDVTVTVTNTYVNARSKPSIYAGKVGSYNYGDKLRITATKEGSNFLWGQVVRSEEDDTPVAWIALMYTNYETAIKGDDAVYENNSTVVAKARIKAPVNGYVNVRSGAGTDNTIIGSLSYDTMVDIYEIQYVNGYQWGRCSQGWFSLSYADVTRLVAEKNETSQVGFTSYAFTGTLTTLDNVRTTAGGSVKVDFDALNKQRRDAKQTEYQAGQSFTVTNVTNVNSQTWGKIECGWILLNGGKFDGVNIATGSDMNLDIAKFEVIASSATVRSTPETSGTRVDTLTKGVEFDVSAIYADETTIWGYANKVGDVNGNTYVGWVNLSSRYVKRNNSPTIAVDNDDDFSGQLATIVGAENVNVRKKPSIYGALVCTIAQGTTCEVIGKPDDGWYRLNIKGREGQTTWVYGQYLEIKEAGITGSVSEGVTGGDTAATLDTGKGIIANTYAGVNVRQTAGIGGAFLGKILPGTLVEVKETTMVGTTKWGKVEQGWICMDYVTMISYQDYPEYSGSNGNGSGSGNTVTNAQPAIYTGYVAMQSTPATVDAMSVTGTVDENGREYPSTSQTNLIVFKTTDINSDTVRKLSNGDPVTVHEILTVEEEMVVTDGTPTNQGSTSSVTRKTTYWARINDGYIRSPGNNLALDALDEATYTLVNQEQLPVYTDNGYGQPNLSSQKTVTVNDGDFNGTMKLYVEKGDQVTVTNVVILNNTVYGLVEFANSLETGWVELTKMSKGAIYVAVEEETPAVTEPESNEPIIGSTGKTGNNGGFISGTGKYTGKVVNVVNTPLKARRTASQTATIDATFNNGANLTIYETCISEGMAWGRCDAGWVYLYYVRLTPASGSAIDANIVFTDNTMIYDDSSCSNVVGTYTKMAVIDIYEKVGDMVRTDQGWVSKANLLHAS